MSLDTKQYYVSKEGTSCGPLTKEKMKEVYGLKQISDETYVWDGKIVKDQTPIKNIPENVGLKKYLIGTPPPSGRGPPPPVRPRTPPSPRRAPVPTRSAPTPRAAPAPMAGAPPPSSAPPPRAAAPTPGAAPSIKRTAGASSGGGGGRADLLSAIRSGKKLKTVKPNDDSSKPATAGLKPGGASIGGAGRGMGAGRPAPMSMQEEMASRLKRRTAATPATTAKPSFQNKPSPAASNNKPTPAQKTRQTTTTTTSSSSDQLLEEFKKLKPSDWQYKAIKKILT